MSPAATRRWSPRGYFGGFSFSPDGERTRLLAGSERQLPGADRLYKVPADRRQDRSALTKDHNSLDPLWGPGEKIVFVKQLGAKKRRYGPKNELFLMNSDGTGVKRLTDTKVDPLLQGLYPTAWSADGNRLLAEFEGQDTSYAVTVNPKTGAQRPLDKRNQGESGFVGTAISRRRQHRPRLHRRLRTRPRPRRRHLSPTAAASRRSWSRTPIDRTRAGECPALGADSLVSQQPDLAQDRDAVRVDVLALHQAVLERDHVDAVPVTVLPVGSATRSPRLHRRSRGSRSPSIPGRRPRRGRRGAGSRTRCRARSRRSSRCGRGPPRRSPTRPRCGSRRPCRARASP